MAPLSSLLAQQVLILQQRQLIQLENKLAAGLAIEKVLGEETEYKTLSELNGNKVVCLKLTPEAQ